MWQDSKSGWYVGACDPLKLTASGETFSELSADMEGVTQDLLQDLLKSGDLDAFLKMRGWSYGVAVKLTPTSRVRFDVPWEVKRLASMPREFVHA
ncbi:MAG: hypothetical protein HYY18_09280 [Planctomycetes bacterium]|nr:hypothetical protein [Planctomycetota bacterium]